MDDKEFAALDPLAAQWVVSNIADEAERTRLRLLYASKRGVPMDGLKDPPGGGTLVRPFGKLGRRYRVGTIGLSFYVLAWVSAFCAIAAEIFLRDGPGLIRWGVVIGGAIAAGCLQTAVVFVGKPVSEDDAPS
jgi:hypothetical protein